MGEHRVAGADLQPASLRLGEPAEEAHQHLVAFAVRVDASAELRDPQLDPVVGELREHQLELAARERPLRFGDHERRPPTTAISSVA